jgi:hypothetical protein
MEQTPLSEEARPTSVPDCSAPNRFLIWAYVASSQNPGFEEVAHLARTDRIRNHDVLQPSGNTDHQGSIRLLSTRIGKVLGILERFVKIISIVTTLTTRFEIPMAGSGRWAEPCSRRSESRDEGAGVHSARAVRVGEPSSWQTEPCKDRAIMSSLSNPRRRPSVRITLQRAARLHRLVSFLAETPRNRAVILSELRIGLRTFYRELELLKRCGVRVRHKSKLYLLSATAEEAEGRLPFPDPQLSFSEMAELAGCDCPAGARLAKLLATVTEHPEPPKKRQTGARKGQKATPKGKRSDGKSKA